MPWNVMEQVLHTLQVPGRIEMLSVSPRFIVLVDYAHNAMALEALLTTLQDYHPGRISASSDAAVTVRQNDGFRWEKWQEDWRILWW